ncbi:hypothetical protein EON65_01500 [archaeon]|nr:MAG: hypothetical protein EON65_01500 [archaeon]
MPGITYNNVVEDKENVAPVKIVDQAKTLTKPCNSSKRGKFTQILSEATNQAREQWDERYAADTQLDEAVILVEEWVMEQKDYELAKELSAAFEKEAIVDNQMAAIRSEAAAIQAAVEERRRLKADEKARKDQERADEVFAKRLLEEEEKGTQQLYEDDAKLAQQLAGMVTPVKDMKRSDMKEKETPSTPLIDSFMEHKEAKADSKHDESDIEDDLRRLNQFIKDEAYSHKVVKTELRALFQHKKRVAMEACLDLSARDEKTVARLWAAADAEVEDVQGAVALTLLLPNIQKLTVTLKKNGKTLRVEATRLVVDSVAAEPNALNSSFIAEFQLEGGELRIQPADVTHVYSSETGFLHVYIEDVNLNFDNKHREEKGSSSKLAVGKFFTSMKEGFSRVFALKK